MNRRDYDRTDTRAILEQILQDPHSFDLTCTPLAILCDAIILQHKHISALRTHIAERDEWQPLVHATIYEDADALINCDHDGGVGFVASRRCLIELPIDEFRLYGHVAP